MSIGEKIKKIRNDWKMTQEEFGNLFGLNRTKISNVERDFGKGNQKIIIDWLIENRGFTEDYFYSSNYSIEKPKTDVRDKYIQMLEKQLDRLGAQGDEREEITLLMQMTERMRSDIERLEAKLDRVLENKNE